jgi:uncharacterized protein
MTLHVIKNIEPAEPASVSTIDNIDALRSYVQKAFANVPGSHDWDHTKRVEKMALKIGAKEGADLTVLSIAALLHDIGRCHQDQSNGEVCHACKGEQLARPLIKDLPISAEQIANILHAIRAHRFRDDDVPETIEAQVIFDADKLDAMGAIGVARAYLFAGEIGARLHNPDIDVTQVESYSWEDTGFREYKVKLCKIKDRLLTPTGRKIAEGRHQFMTTFFEQFIGEYKVER